MPEHSPYRRAAGAQHYEDAWLDFDERIWPYLRARGVSKDAAWISYMVASACTRLNEVTARLDQLLEQGG